LLYFPIIAIVSLKNQNPQSTLSEKDWRVHAISNLLHCESADEFKETLEQAGDTPVVFDFWASWCGPCMRVGPTFEELAGEFDGQVTFAKLNADAAIEILQELGVRSIPTFILFKNGDEVDRLTGACDKRTLSNFIEQVLK
jgi:thioredoxin 1